MPERMILSKPVEQAELRARLHAGVRILTLEATLAHNKRLSEALHQIEKIWNWLRAFSTRCCLHAAYAMATTSPTGFSCRQPGFRAMCSIFSLWIHIWDSIALMSRVTAWGRDDVPRGGSPVLHGRVVDRFLFTEEGIQSPAEVVRMLNSRFCSEESDITSYFTLIYGVIDPETGEGWLCQAGHPTPVIVNADSAVTSVGDGGPPVGLIPDLSWEDVAFTLHPGIAYAYSVTVLPSVRTSAASSLARNVSNAGFMSMPGSPLTSSCHGSVTT